MLYDIKKYEWLIIIIICQEYTLYAFDFKPFIFILYFLLLVYNELDMNDSDNLYQDFLYFLAFTNVWAIKAFCVEYVAPNKDINVGLYNIITKPCH